MSTTTKKPRERLTLKDSTDLLIALDKAIEDHIDEIELNEGALPDWMEQLLNEVVAAREERGAAIVFKLDEFTGYAATAKATKDRAARRQKVWENTIAALKRYAVNEIERGGGDPIKAATATLRLQNNSVPSTSLTAAPEEQQAYLLYCFDEITPEFPSGLEDAVIERRHPLAAFITVQRVATLDTKALGAAYEVRWAALFDEARQYDTLLAPGEEGYDAALVAAMELRRRHVVDGLAQEFPGVRCVRGRHLRID